MPPEPSVPQLTTKREGQELVISVPPQNVVTAPLRLFYGMEGGGTETRFRVRLGAKSSLHLIEITAPCTQPTLSTNLVVELEEGATLYHIRLDTSPTLLESRSVFHATLKKDATLHYLLAAATRNVRHTSSVVLEEEGASVSLQGLSIVPPHHEAHFSFVVDHQAECTSSSQLYKGLVADQGSGTTESRVHIRKEAQQSESRQHSHFLTLGTCARTVNKPVFEIAADDVVAFHGATSGMLDSEALFYLNSRGLDEQQARLHIVEGFCAELLRQLPAEGIVACSQHILTTVRGMV